MPSGRTASNDGLPFKAAMSALASGRSLAGARGGCPGSRCSRPRISTGRRRSTGSALNISPTVPLSPASSAARRLRRSRAGRGRLGCGCRRGWARSGRCRTRRPEVVAGLRWPGPRTAHAGARRRFARVRAPADGGPRPGRFHPDGKLLVDLAQGGVQLPVAYDVVVDNMVAQGRGQPLRWARTSSMPRRMIATVPRKSRCSPAVSASAKGCSG